ncbi:MAG: amidophosphoribosyltransferase [Gemmatimonadaceae bacterium]|nr:amidophosphoribosyltransferase [Gemmatimonadaceae bacterium]NUP72786.1 amidophosphoribosyltransferase [Gemmatimonadaceae bacterium]NUS31428.1 amidophosphoribosyltransferase [Gemmatimonadaceae bacterium]NUS46357.1 amidophosphoribosyltransferase [Gemmatimonadaceae bacterium]
MCGIFGVRGQADAVALTKLGLYSLQHRGQESAGIVAVDERGDARGVRSMGLVSDIPNPQLDALHGTMAIGHTRYSTAGSSTIENAQPVLVSSRGGHISLAHNGNLTNAGELRAELEDLGSIFASSMDSEVIVHRLARSTAAKPEERLADALRGVEGAFSILIMLGDTLLAARDPRGWRPLVMGRLDGSPVFGSETCALDIVGAQYERDIQPGEIFAVDESGERSLFPFERQELRRCVFEHVYFARPDSRIFGGSVDRARRALGRRLAQECPAPNADLVFSVPDSSNSAAIGFAEESGLPYELALIRNHYVGRTFIQPTQATRDAKVRLKYNAVREVLEGRRVVMVDDSIVRGTTTRGLVQLVRAAGAVEVHMRVSSAPVTGPCYYGIDTPSREELIAANHTQEEIRLSLGVDSLGYLSLDGMLNAVPGGPHGFCHACFSGDYPTPPPTDPDKLRFGCGC